ncbi:TetR/AcrR family transcriptional regulator [Arthrobacter sp. 31Y]|uniref:TetR/AcrR family transcriptional regulator n=1 Tax=Arthrobacter sp. 31Y TaxID=1115632 RepID=UPI0004665F28|nr:TetR family transcriptional regulator [Arthrobacter sp. 31Y]
MAWDTDATKAKLLNAAISEFSERGFSGGRVHEISKKSGTNPERIYFYFGNKAKLFEAALTHELTTALEDVPVNGQGPIAVADFAGRYFDFAVSHPSLARLTSWEGLERSSPVGARVRALQAANKVTEIQAALPGVTVTQAEDLLLSIVTLCHAWVSSPNVHEVITGQLDLERRRRTIVRHTELMADDTP